MPVGYRVGDHCLFVVDFSTASMVGTCPPKIIRPALRRLNTKIPNCALRYNRALRKQILCHRVLERMIRMAESDGSKEAILARLNQLDREREHYMNYAAKKCCQINWDKFPSPQRHHYGSVSVKYTVLSSGGMPERFGTEAI
jgi:hypothetical protein